MGLTRSRRRLHLLALLAFLAVLGAASCAPVTPPAAPPVPPSAPPAPGVQPPAGVTAPFHLDREPWLDVGLRWTLDSLTVEPQQAGPLRVTAPGRDERLGETRAAVHIRKGAGAWVVDWEPRPGETTSTPLQPGDTLWVGAAEAPGAGPSGGGNRFRCVSQTWRGQFRIFPNARRKLTLADRLPLETYLLGVVPGEIGGLTEATIEAGRAQAVAARSYTIFYLGRRASEGFDVYGTVEDQIYGPVETERELPTRCVVATRGNFALSAGRPIRANYCSTCGGISADVWEAWPATPLSYLVSHRDRDRDGDYCAESVQYRWREEWGPEEFLGNIAHFGPIEGATLPPQGLGELVDVRVAARSRSGRVMRLVVETTKGDVVLPADQIRRVVRRAGSPFVILRSTLFKIGVRRDPETRRALAVVATGAGSGHGVGLCQTGAVAMAKAKLTAKQILTHYYPGIQLERLY